MRNAAHLSNVAKSTILTHFNHIIGDNCKISDNDKYLLAQYHGQGQILTILDF